MISVALQATGLIGGVAAEGWQNARGADGYIMRPGAAHPAIEGNDLGREVMYDGSNDFSTTN